MPGVYSGTYNRDTNPNLLAKNKWIGLRNEVENLADGSVRLRLYIDKGWQGSWNLIAEAVDDGVRYGPALKNSGYTGIRTDFMDVDFENYRLNSL